MVGRRTDEKLWVASFAFFPMPEVSAPQHDIRGIHRESVCFCYEISMEGVVVREALYNRTHVGTL